jgi:hypothetical protein
MYYTDNFVFRYVAALNGSCYFPRVGEQIGSLPSWGAEVHYRVPESPSSAGWIHSTLSFSKIHLMLYSHLRLRHQCVLFTRGFPTSHFPHACYISDQSNRSWLNNIQWRVQSVKLMQFSPSVCYFTPSRPTQAYFPQHSVPRRSKPIVIFIFWVVW